jgi:hypothetical protein
MALGTTNDTIPKLSDRLKTKLAGRLNKRKTSWLLEHVATKSLATRQVSHKLAPESWQGNNQPGKAAPVPTLKRFPQLQIKLERNKKSRLESGHFVTHRQDRRQSGTATLAKPYPNFLTLVMRANTAIYKRPNLQITDWPPRVVQMPSGKELEPQPKGIYLPVASRTLHHAEANALQRLRHLQKLELSSTYLLVSSITLIVLISATFS